MRWILLARATLGSIALAAGMAANVLLPLGDAVSLTLIYPAIILGLSPIMGESYLSLDFVAVAVSIAGVIFIIEPSFIFDSIKPTNPVGALAATLGALFLALGGVLVRRISNQAHPLHIMTYFTALPVLPSLIWCAVERETLTYNFDLKMVTWLAVMTLGALMTQVFMSYSLRTETINRMIPFTLLQMVLAYINDYFFFDSIPTKLTLAGAALITLSTLYSMLLRQ